MSARFRRSLNDGLAQRTMHANRLGGFAKSEIDPMPTQGRVIVVLERHDPVITQSGRSTPDHHIAVRERYPARPLRSIQSSEKKDGRDAKGNRNDGCIEGPFVAVLMQ